MCVSVCKGRLEREVNWTRASCFPLLVLLRETLRPTEVTGTEVLHNPKAVVENKDGSQHPCADGSSFRACVCVRQ